MFKKRKKEAGAFIIGVLFTLILSGTVVMANAEMREIIFGVRVSYNGNEVRFDDDMRPFIMDGRTFLPVRAIADLVGLEVDFADGTVLLSDGTANYAAALVGRWEFVESNLFIYYFISDGDIEFFADGTVIEYLYEEPAVFSVPNPGQLTVTGDWDERTFHFTFDISGDILTITDQDGDYGVYRRG